MHARVVSTALCETDFVKTANFFHKSRLPEVSNIRICLELDLAFRKSFRCQQNIEGSFHDFSSISKAFLHYLSAVAMPNINPNLFPIRPLATV